MNFPSDLAPLAPLRGEGLGVRGFERASVPCIERCALARCAPSSPALLPHKAGGEGSQSLRFLWLHRSLPNLHALQISISPPRVSAITKFVLMLLCCVATTDVASGQEPADDDASLKDAAGILLVIGASGLEEYRENFDSWTAKWEKVARQSETPLKLIGRGAEKPSDREQLQSVLDNVPKQGASPLWVVMIGHGTFNRGVAKFNLRGPDVSATELSQWLEPQQRPVVIVNCASASGPFVNRLSGKNRIVVTATKSGNEDNYARFGEYFARAIASPDSDLDHDDEVSVHEAFLRASADVRQFYETEDRIATEHALIDDNGDGKGTPATMFRGTRSDGTAKDGSQLDGPIASRVTLSPAGNRLPLTPEELTERASIEDQLDVLRSRKDLTGEQAYDAQLEPLMLRLAKIYRAAEGRLEQPEDPTDKPEPTSPKDD
jgi:hypothetical protein